MAMKNSDQLFNDSDVKKKVIDGLFSEKTNGLAFKLNVGLIHLITEPGSAESIKFMSQLYNVGHLRPKIYEIEMI